MLPEHWRSEKLLTIAEAAELLELTTQRVYGLINEGTKLPDGGRVCLECVRCGKLYTSHEAIDRWVERSSPAPKTGAQARTAGEAQKAGTKAFQALLKRQAQAKGQGRGKAAAGDALGGR